LSGIPDGTVWEIPVGGKVCSIPVKRFHTLIVGSGAASLSCALRLHSLGIDDTAVLTDNLYGGTSRNTGSDKQTYYKMSDSEPQPDSPYDMAGTLMRGGCMHGDIALAEAINSLNCFYNLISLGVDFPHNKYGGYTGYRTDHDENKRGISSGPYTSKKIFDALFGQVRFRQIPIFDYHRVLLVLTSGGRAAGALAMDKRKAGSANFGVEIYLSENVVFGTGGPGDLYGMSAYPKVHKGGIGAALEAGAEAANLTESQFGLASLKFRWNLSGSYQQAMPCYYSTDKDCSSPRPFLNDHFQSMRELSRAQFLKGYQWPFDPEKLRPEVKGGSSLIDLLVHMEIRKGRRVFIDFSKNPEGGGAFGEFSIDGLDGEARSYLELSGALKETPIERLERINPQAAALYRDHGIDLHREPLEIGVCCQHNNGGLAVNVWWESVNVKHLFPIGEVSGTHGVHRPGGSALNSGQVGALRAAQKISAVYNDYSLSHGDIKEELTSRAAEMLEIISGIHDPGSENRAVFDYKKEYMRRMSRCGGIIRDADDISAACTEALEQFKSFNNLKTPRKELIPYALICRQNALTQWVYLEALRDYLEKGGGSRGSFLVVDKAQADHGPGAPGQSGGWTEPCTGLHVKKENKKLRSKIQIIRLTGSPESHGPEKSEAPGVSVRYEECRWIPSETFWFEDMWKKYTNKEIFKEE
jgi:succinate dehydrogenase/fumarate reductase flavoprotein subunit